MVSRLLGICDRLVEMAEALSRDVKSLKADSQALRLDFLEFAARFDGKGPNTESVQGLFPISCEADFLRADEALRAPDKLDKVVSLV